MFSSPEFSDSSRVDINEALLKHSERVCDQSICTITTFSGQRSPTKNKMSYLKPSQMIKVCSLATFLQPEFLRKRLLPWESVWESGTHRSPCVDGPALLSSLQEARERTGPVSSPAGGPRVLTGD